jgi:serine/threonine protein kinase
VRRDDDDSEQPTVPSDTVDAPTRTAVDEALAPTLRPVTPATLVSQDSSARYGREGSAHDPRLRRPSLSQAELHPGDKLGDRYVVRGFLGMGGMGAVYHVFDEILGDDVALKAVRSAIATTSGLRDEVKIAQKVTHENVCRIYDLEDIAGRHFVKMEYVPGQTLAARIEAGKLPITRAVSIARGVAAGLAAAHARGIVHRDLKPGNVMLDGERPVLMDFGLAQYAHHSAGDRSGTPGYMSPEQLAGVALDHRSDLFALGCLLYEMLTAERLFGAGSMTEIEARQAMTAVPDVREKRPDTPRWLARAVALLLSREREPRPDGLARLLRGESRSKLPLVLAGAGVLALGAGAAWWMTRGKPEWTYDPILVKRPSYATELVSRATIAPDSQSLVYISESGYGDPRTIYRMPVNGGAVEKVGVAPHRADQIRHLRDGSGFVMCGHDDTYEKVMLQRGGSITALGVGHDPDDCGDSVIAVRTAPSGDEYLRFRLVLLSKAAPGTERVVFESEPGQMIDHPRCDAAGKRVVFSMWEITQPAIFLLDLTTNGPAVKQQIGETPTFTPGGRSIVFTDENHQISELDLATGKVERFRLSEGPYFAPEVSPDGNVLLFSRETYASTLYLGGGTSSEGRPIPTELEQFRSPWITADLSTVVLQLLERDNTLVAVDARSGAQTKLAQGSRPFLSRDGTRVYYRARARPSELHVVSIKGGPSTLVIDVPVHPIRDGYEAEDGIHLSLEELDQRHQPTGAILAVHLPPGTQKLIAEGSGLVMPGPGGRWKARVLAENVELTSTDGRRRAIRCIDTPTWVDDHQLGCVTRRQLIEVFDLDRVDHKPARIELPWQPRGVLLAQDGKHWMATRDSDSVTRLAITNFAERPWRPE